MKPKEIVYFKEAETKKITYLDFLKVWKLLLIESNNTEIFVWVE